MTVKSAPNCAVPDNPATIGALKLKMSLCDCNNNRLKTASSLGEPHRSLQNKAGGKKSCHFFKSSFGHVIIMI